MRTVAYCGNYTALTTTEFGRKIYVDTRDISIASHIMMQGQWEPWITKAFQALFRPGWSFCDVGANMGWYTLLACHLGAREVMAFEPNTRLAELLGMSIAVNGFRDIAKVQRRGCSDWSRSAELWWNPVENGGGAVHEKPERAPEHADSPDWLVFEPRLSETIELVTLDESVPHIDFLKIDVEGHEPAVLRGAKRHLERGLMCLVEHHAGDRETLEWLVSLGYSLRHVQHDSHLSALMAPSDTASLPNADMLLASR